MGNFHLPLEPEAAQALSRLRRRHRHHAGARRSSRPCSPPSRTAGFTLVYANRADQLDHVPRGARGPEEPASRPPLPGPRPRAARRRTSSSSPAGSTRTSAASCSTHWIDLASIDTAFICGPRADDARDRRRPARARPRPTARSSSSCSPPPSRAARGTQGRIATEASTPRPAEATVTLDGAHAQLHDAEARA